MISPSQETGLPTPINAPPRREKEAVFQMRLAEMISLEGHLVALRDAGTKAWPRRFSSNGLCPDLLVQTNAEWPLHEAFPAIAIEAKVGFNDSVSDVLDGILQLIELKRNESQIVYKVNDQVVKPVLYLFVNPCLLEWDVATYWSTWKPKDQNCCASHTNRVLATLLSRFTGGLLGKDLKFNYQGHVNGHQMARIVSLRRCDKVWPANKIQRLP